MFSLCKNTKRSRIRRIVNLLMSLIKPTAYCKVVKILKHILCADTHVSPKYEHNAFIYTLIYDIYMRGKRLMHRDSDIQIPHYVHTLLIKHTMSRKIDEPKYER